MNRRMMALCLPFFSFLFVIDAGMPVIDELWTAVGSLNDPVQDVAGWRTGAAWRPALVFADG